MRLLGRFLLLAAAVALGCWLWGLAFPNEERLIRRHLANTARAASFGRQEGALERIGNIAELSGCFTPEVQVHFDVPRQGQFSLEGRDQIMGVAAKLREYTSSLKVDFLDVSVVLDPGRESATATLTARAETPTDRDLFVQELKLFLKKQNRRWLIRRIETVKTLSRSAPTHHRSETSHDT